MPRLSPPEIAHRRNGMGATDVVEALGLAPWEGAGPARVYLEKTEGVTRTDDDGCFDWGHRQERVLLDWYSETVAPIIPSGHVPHREHPWLWATLDATTADRIVEAKHVGSMMAAHWDTGREDGVPSYVRAQCIIGQACLGRRLTDVVASLGGRPPHVWTVAWDEQLWQAIFAQAMAFWAHVVKRSPPPIDGTPATRELIRLRYPSNEYRVMVPAIPEVDAIGQDRAEQARIRSEADETIKRLDAELLESIGKNDGIKGNGWRMTHKLDKNGVRRSRFTVRDE